MKIVTVFGISGVGKTTLIKDFIKNSEGWSHIQAGSLIKSVCSDMERDKLRLSGKELILSNQKLMVTAFWEQIKSENLSKVIFDGHSIIDMGEELLAIPIEVIEALKPTKIVFVKNDPSLILNRRLNDSSRDRPVLAEEDIIRHQDFALETAKSYGAFLDIPVVIIDGSNPLSLS